MLEVPQLTRKLLHFLPRRWLTLSRTNPLANS